MERYLGMVELAIEDHLPYSPHSTGNNVVPYVELVFVNNRIQLKIYNMT